MMYNVHVPYKGFRADCRALEAERKAKGMFYFLKILKKTNKKSFNLKEAKQIIQNKHNILRLDTSKIMI